MAAGRRSAPGAAARRTGTPDPPIARATAASPHHGSSPRPPPATRPRARRLDPDRRSATGMPMESRMRGNAHVRFGGRPEERERPKGRHRASCPPKHVCRLAGRATTRSAATSGTPTSALTRRPAAGSRAPVATTPVRRTRPHLRAHRQGILAAIRLGLTNARLEGLNSTIRLISHRSSGFHSAGALIALFYLPRSTGSSAGGSEGPSEPRGP